MKKILFVLGASTYPHVTGGMEIFNYYLIRSLKNKFDIYYSSCYPLNINEINRIRTYYIRPIKYLFPFQLFIHLLFNPQIKDVLISFSSAHAIVWKLYGSICTLLKRRYYVVIHYGDVTPSKNDEIYYNFFHGAQKVIAVSEDIKKNYDKKYKISCQVIYPLVPFYKAIVSKEDLRKQYFIPSDRKVICMIGSLKNMKNPDTILKALRLLSKDEIEHCNPHIVYAGGGILMDELKKMAKEFGLEQRVTFLGNVPKEKVNEIFKLSDYYLIASDFEGTSISLLEAMFNALPIIASRAPGITQTIQETKECIMYTTKNELELKECLLYYINHEEQANNKKEAAYQHYLSQYKYDSVVEEYSKLFS